MFILHIGFLVFTTGNEDDLKSLGLMQLPSLPIRDVCLWRTSSKQRMIFRFYACADAKQPLINDFLSLDDGSIIPFFDIRSVIERLAEMLQLLIEISDKSTPRVPSWNRMKYNFRFHELEAHATFWSYKEGAWTESDPYIFFIYYLSNIILRIEL